MQLRFVLNNKNLKSKVRRINLKLILLNQFAWILEELFTILRGRYQPKHLYLRADFTLPWGYCQGLKCIVLMKNEEHRILQRLRKKR